jgi:hypothetical protein
MFAPSKALTRRQIVAYSDLSGPTVKLKHIEAAAYAPFVERLKRFSLHYFMAFAKPPPAQRVQLLMETEDLLVWSVHVGGGDSPGNVGVVGYCGEPYMFYDFEAKPDLRLVEEATRLIVPHYLKESGSDMLWVIFPKGFEEAVTPLVTRIGFVRSQKPRTGFDDDFACFTIQRAAALKT